MNNSSEECHNVVRDVSINKGLRHLLLNDRGRESACVHDIPQLNVGFAEVLRLFSLVRGGAVGDDNAILGEIRKRSVVRQTDVCVVFQCPERADRFRWSYTFNEDGEEGRMSELRELSMLRSKLTLKGVVPCRGAVRTKTS